MYDDLLGKQKEKEVETNRTMKHLKAGCSGTMSIILADKKDGDIRIAKMGKETAFYIFTSGQWKLIDSWGDFGDYDRGYTL